MCAVVGQSLIKNAKNDGVLGYQWETLIQIQIHKDRTLLSGILWFSKMSKNAKMSD